MLLLLLLFIGDQNSGNNVLNHFSNGKILDETKLKEFADENSNDAKMTTSLFDRVGNTVGKGENAGFPKPPSLRSS